MAFAAVERLIAFRYLRARRDEGFISVIATFSLVGITLGVGTLIVVMSVMNGFRFEMLRQMSSISGRLGVQGSRGGIDATPELLADMKKVPGVLCATPTAEGQVMAVAAPEAGVFLEQPFLDIEPVVLRFLIGVVRVGVGQRELVDLAIGEQHVEQGLATILRLLGNELGRPHLVDLEALGKFHELPQVGTGFARRIDQLVKALVTAMPHGGACSCQGALTGARVAR